MKKYTIVVTSECIGSAGAYNQDCFEGENIITSESASGAILEEIQNFRLTGETTWFSETSAMVETDIEGGKKDFFFDAAEIED